jgi:hypothetical protein
MCFVLRARAQDKSQNQKSTLGIKKVFFVNILDMKPTSFMKFPQIMGEVMCFVHALPQRHLTITVRMRGTVPTWTCPNQPQSPL